MEATLDSSTLISLAWSGLLPLLDAVPLDLVVPDVVRAETVDAGLGGGHADAAAIASAIADRRTATTPSHERPDARVLHSARASGLLVANDAALGRRARSWGLGWLRTADLVVLCVRCGALEADAARDAVAALLHAGRLTPELAAEYEQELS